MVVFLLIILLLISNLAIIYIINSDDKETCTWAIIINVTIFLLVFLLFIDSLRYENIKETIPAIEVYRGNTDLKISYIDSIPQDSVVIWKRRIYKHVSR